MEPHEPYYPGVTRAIDIGLIPSYITIIKYYLSGRNESDRTYEVIEQLYWKCIEVLDQRISAVLDLIPSDAVALITGDHGEAFSHGTGKHGLLYDEVIKVPLFFQNLTIPEDPVGQIDVPRHILDTVGINVPDAWKSTLPKTEAGFRLVGGPRQECRYIGYRTETHKIIRTLTPDGKQTVDTEVYNLERDPEEETNIYAESTWRTLEERVTDIQKKLELAGTARPDADVSDTVEQRLKELGYR